MTAKKQEAEPTTPVQENNDCFIIMPIADHEGYNQGHFRRVYEDIFAPACEAAGYNPVRADDVVKTNLIHLDILKKLLESPMAICDLSTRNPNVLFELGLRQAFDMPTILVQEEGTPPIFDISMLRYTTYSKTLDYRQVLSDQDRIKEVLIDTGLSANDSNEVNSIIKLLSITKPAKLDDPSKFGEKQYFDLLMSEIQNIKTTIAKNVSPSTTNNIKYVVSETKVNNKDLVRIRITLSSETSLEAIESLFNFSKNFHIRIEDVYTARNKDSNKSYLMITCGREISEELLENISVFSELNNINIDDIRTSRVVPSLRST